MRQAHHVYVIYDQFIVFAVFIYRSKIKIRIPWMRGIIQNNVEEGYLFKFSDVSNFATCCNPT